MEEFDERSYNLTLSKVGTVSLRIQVLGFFSLFVRVFFFFLFTKYVYMQQMHDILRISLSYPLNNELSYMYVPGVYNT